MVKISDAFKTEKISLPSYPGSEVEFKTDIQMKALLDAQQEKDDMAKGLKIATAMIVNWNFTDENDQTLPITQENIGLLPIKDVEFLMERITPHVQKKTISGKTK